MSTMNYNIDEFPALNMYKESYDFMMNHPIVKQYKKENKKLKKEIAHLKSMLELTQEHMRMLVSCKKSKRKLTLLHKTSGSISQDVLDEEQIQEPPPSFPEEVREPEPEQSSEVIQTPIDQIQTNIKYIIIENEVEAEEEEVEEEEAEEEEAEVEEEAAEELYEIIINGKTYYYDNKESGNIYEVNDDGEITMEVGIFKNGTPSFY